MFSHYYDKKKIQTVVEENNHRGVVGGLWDEIGEMQLALLLKHGMKSDHTLLDIGCGSLRGGVHFVRFLNAGNYWGTDLNGSLLDAGFDKEIVPLGLTDKLPRAHLVVDEDFSFPSLDGPFDFMMAQSLFTHLPLNHLRLCLERAEALAARGATFLFTYFELPADARYGVPFKHEVGGVTTFAHKDPYHYKVVDLEHVTKGLGWQLESAGPWDHPRSQNCAVLKRV